MGKDTQIEWADSTINTMMGCDGCELWTKKVRTCYAGHLVERYKGRKGYPKSFDQPELFLERLDEALKWPDLTGKPRSDKPWLDGLPRIIFLNDLGDSFTESLPLDWLAPLLPRMADSPHQWLILTKRVRRMREFSESHPFPENVWAMCSVDTQGTADARIAELLRVKARIRGISLEPILSGVNLGLLGTLPGDWTNGNYVAVHQRLHWVIVGGESGNNCRPCEVEWVADIVRQCRETDTPCFVKQLGTGATQSGKLLQLGSKGGQMEKWPEHLRVRQMPGERIAIRHNGELFA